MTGSTKNQAPPEAASFPKLDPLPLPDQANPLPLDNSLELPVVIEPDSEQPHLRFHGPEEIPKDYLQEIQQEYEQQQEKGKV